MGNGRLEPMRQGRMVRCLVGRLCMLLGALLALAPASMAGLPGYVEEALSGRVLLPVEGVWQFPDDGAVIMIHRTSASTLMVTLLDSPDLSVEPGTIIGTARTTPQAGVYDAVLDGNSVPGAKDKTATIHVADGTLSIRPYSQGWSVSLRRLFYHFFKVGISHHDTRPGGLDGAVRVYPTSPSAVSTICL